MAINRIQAGAAAIHISLEDEQFKKDWSNLRRSVSRIQDTLLKIGAAASVASAAMGGFFALTLRSAIQTEAGIQRFGLIFGKNADMMRSKLEDLAQSTSMSMATLMTQSSAFGAIFSELRTVNESMFVEMVANTQKAVIDLVGLGVPLQEAADRMKSAFTSTGEAVDQFGFNIRDPQIKRALTNMGINLPTRELGEVEKQMIKLQLIQDAIRRGDLDFIKTMTITTSKFAILRSQWEQFAFNFNRLVLPVLKFGLSILIAFFRFINATPIKYLVSALGLLSLVLLAATSALAGAALGLAALAKAMTVLVTATINTSASLAVLQLQLKTLIWHFKGAYLWTLRAAAAMKAYTAAMLGAAGGIPGILLMGAAGVGMAMMGGKAPPVDETRIQALTRAQNKPRGFGWLAQMFPSPNWEIRRQLLAELKSRESQAAPAAISGIGAPAAAQGIRGTRMISQQLGFAAGVGSAEEQTATATGVMAQIAEKVFGDGAIKVEASS